MADAMASPGMALAVAASTNPTPARRELISTILNGLNNSELLAPFLRAQYGSDIIQLQESTRIFRDNSIGMAATGVLLRTHGTVLVPELTEVLLREGEGKPDDVLKRWLPVLKNMPQLNRIVFRLAFLAARRKFPDKLVPLTALGGMVMLRFVMADVGEKAPQLSKLLQGMMQITVFSQTCRGECELETFDRVAEALVDLTRLEGNYVPRTNFSPLDFVECIAPLIDEIKGAVKPPAPGALHPLVFSLLEVIENALIGPDDDLRQKLIGAIIF
jgi:hypothetical protein